MKKIVPTYLKYFKITKRTIYIGTCITFLNLSHKSLIFSNFAVLIQFVEILTSNTYNKIF